MQAVDRELSAGGVISRGFSLFRAHFIRILLPLLLGAVVAAIVRVLFARQFSSILQQLSMFEKVPFNETNVGPAFQVFTQALGLSALQNLVLWIVSVPFLGVALKVAYDASTGKTSSLQESFSSGVSRLPTLLAAGFIVGILVHIASILVIPGILLIIMFMMFLPAVMIENASTLNSLGRSRRLVSRRWGRIFIVGVAAVLISILLGILLDTLFFTNDIYLSAALQPFLGLISDVLNVSFLAVLYQSLLFKERGELTSAERAHTAV